MFVHVYTPLAFEIRCPSVPAELVAVLAAFPHFASQAVHQVDIKTATHLNMDDTVNATILVSYCSHRLQRSPCLQPCQTEPAHPLSSNICFPRGGSGVLTCDLLMFLCRSFPCRELSHNQIEDLPSFHRCQRLEEL